MNDIIMIRYKWMITSEEWFLFSMWCDRIKANSTYKANWIFNAIQYGLHMFEHESVHKIMYSILIRFNFIKWITYQNVCSILISNKKKRFSTRMAKPNGIERTTGGEKPYIYIKDFFAWGTTYTIGFETTRIHSKWLNKLNIHV